MSAVYTVLFLPLVVWFILIVVGIVFRLVYSNTIAGITFIVCLAVIVFPPLIILAIVALVFFGLTMLLKYFSGVR